MYVAVKGGEAAIRNAHRLLADRRRGDRSVPALRLDQIVEQLALGVDRVMAEGSLYDRELAALAITQAHGESIVHETVYENRFGFTDALVKMGANIVVHPHGLQDGPRRVPRRNLEQAATIIGPTPLHGADIVVPDLRGGYSHVIAALAAEGESTISNIGIISRGYEKFLSKLQLLGADFDIVG